MNRVDEPVGPTCSIVVEPDGSVHVFFDLLRTHGIDQTSYGRPDDLVDAFRGAAGRPTPIK